MTAVRESALKGRNLLTLDDFSAHEVTYLVEEALAAKRAKAERRFARRLEGRNVCLIFLKPSTRTRASFFVAASDEGACAVTFNHEDLRFGSKESVKDIARVLGRLFDGIAFRGFDHGEVEELARHAGIPVWNALSDEHHPTQVLADLMTLQEEFGRVAGLKMAFVGDGRNNMGNSLIVAAGKMGIDLRIVAPESLQPSGEQVARLLEGGRHPEARITVTDSVAEGVVGCQAIYTDVWVSMGEENLVEERIAMLADYRITPDVMAATGEARCIFLHCLPSLHDAATEFARKHPGICDTEDAVFEGPASRVFQLAENRMHVIKALMVATIGD